MRLFFLIRAVVALAGIASVSALALNYVSKDGDMIWLRRDDPAQAFALDGVWRSRGYGWLWSVEDGSVNVYDESGDLCLKNDRRSFELDDPEMALEVSDDGKTIRVLMDDDQYRYVFDRIDALPAACHIQPPSDPLAVFDAVVTTLTAHYAFFGARNIDWEKAVEAERAKVSADTSDWQLFKTISRLLSHFRDSHVSLEGTIGDDDLEYEPAAEVRSRASIGEKPPTVLPDAPSGYWNPKVVSELLGDTERSGADGDITYGLIGGDIGYLGIGSMSGYSPSAVDRTMRRAAAMFRDAKAVIVDVSTNDGGYDTIARRIAGHFAAERAVAYYKYPGDAETVESQPIYVEPSEELVFAGPVYVITSGRTVSAAEIFVLAMRALPNVTQIGETTDGSLSDILSKPLPNGWSLSLSNEVYLDSNGVGWEGSGIPPQVALPVVSAPESERDLKAAQLLVDHVRSLAAESASTAQTGPNPS